MYKNITVEFENIAKLLLISNNKTKMPRDDIINKDYLALASPSINCDFWDVRDVAPPVPCFLVSFPQNIACTDF